jgi:hypothetical protein
VGAFARALGQGAVLAGAAAFVVAAGYWNLESYLVRYYAGTQNSPHIGLATFVKNLREQHRAPRGAMDFVNMSTPRFDWTYPTVRYLTYLERFTEAQNPAEALPVIMPTPMSQPRDLVFFVWPWNQEYQEAIQRYYPGGRANELTFGSGPGMMRAWAYWVPAGLRHRLHGAIARYEDASGAVSERPEPGFGWGTQGDAPRAGAVRLYPVSARWSATVVNRPSDGAPERRIRLRAPAGARMLVDGRVIEVQPGEDPSEAGAVLAQGQNAIVVQADLLDERTQVALEWLVDAGWASVPSENLWVGPGRGLHGIARADAAPGQREVATSRVDGVLGFRRPPAPTARGTAVWSGAFYLSEPGEHAFRVRSAGTTEIRIDDMLMDFESALDELGMVTQGSASLASGLHRLEITHGWTDGKGGLEVFWRTPEGRWRVVGPDLLVEP